MKKGDSLKFVENRESHLLRGVHAPLGVPMIGFREIFKTADKDHLCRRVASGVPCKITGRIIHEEMDGDANGHKAVAE